MNYKKIKSYEDACKALGLKPISDEVFNEFGEDAKTMAAYHKLAVITRAINEGWQPDWKDRGQEKYEPYMYTNSAGLAYAYTIYAPSNTDTGIGSRLCFPDYDRAAFAVSTFGDLYEDYFRPKDYGTQEQKAADDSKQNAESENGGDDVIREEDDMTDAPDFLKKVVEICKSEIQPLAEADSDNRAIILIAVQDNAKDKDGDAGFGTTIAVVGDESNLSRGLAKFLKQERSQPIIKKAILRNKFDRICEEGVKAIKDILDTLK
jgi:hypothetical protein